MNDSEVMKGMLWTSIVGSHMWLMDHEGSDYDLFTVYQADTKLVLIDKLRYKGKDRKVIYQGIESDQQILEIGHIIHQLKKGNLNFLWGVMSPLYTCFNKETAIDFHILRKIVKKNMAKNFFGAINGITKHNLAHWFAIKIDKESCFSIPFKTKTDLESEKGRKKLKLILRTLHFGINFMQGKIWFDPVVSLPSLQDIKEEYLKFIEVYKKSSLPEKPNEEEYDNFLLELRLNHLKKELT